MYDETNDPSSDATEGTPEDAVAEDETATPPAPAPEHRSATEPKEDEANATTPSEGTKSRGRVPAISVAVVVIVIAALLITWAAGGFKSGTPKTPTTVGGVFLTSIGESKISSLDLSNGQLGAPLRVAVQPTALTSATDSPYLFALDNSSKLLLAINPKTRKVAEKSTVAGLPSQVVVTAAGKQALVLSQNTGNLYAVGIPSTTPPKSVAVPPNPRGIAMSATGTSAYVLQELPGALTPVQVTSGQVGTSLPTNAPLRSITVTPTGQNVYSVDVSTESLLPFKVGKTGLVAATPVHVDMAPTALDAVSSEVLYVAGIAFGPKSSGLLNEVVNGAVAEKATVRLPGEPLDMANGPHGTVLVAGIVSSHTQESRRHKKSSKASAERLPKGYVADVQIGSSKPLWQTTLSGEVTSIAVVPGS